jgi:hypothetical protein
LEIYCSISLCMILRTILKNNPGIIIKIQYVSWFSNIKSFFFCCIKIKKLYF